MTNNDGSNKEKEEAEEEKAPLQLIRDIYEERK